ncbi:hypothetical protein ACHAC9_10025 [Massilia sp. CMS3.1]|uniref:hypothetical protein n=1 Tax=Massilia sp. CMS3.1 TaxID=3373083 RepID=UPI003EE43FB8
MSKKPPLNSRVLIFLAGTVLHGAALAADVVPLTFINGLPFVTVTVGAVSSRLMIDSGGALGISIPETTVHTSGAVTLLDQTTKFSDLHGQAYEVRNLVAQQVKVGTTELGPVEGRVHVQWGGAPEGPQAELTRAREAGAIGLAAFGKRPLMFDYRRGTLSIFKPGEGPQAGQQDWRALPLAYGKEGPNISLSVNGKALKFVLDTGAQVNIVNAASLAPDSAASRCQACDPRELGQVQAGDGRPLGSLAAERMDLNGAPFDGILGAPFFQRYRVLLDLPTRRLLISPHDKPDFGKPE